MIVFGILTAAASSLWLWPLARRALRPARDLPYFEALALVVGVGLSLGGLSWLMMWLGLLPGAWLRPPFVLAIPWIGLALSVWIKRRRFVFAVRQCSRESIAAHRSLAAPLPFWLAVVCAGALAVIAINLISYPFYTYDVLSRYAPNARQLFTAGYIPSTLTGYPLGVPMLYALGFMAAGSVNDHVAGALSAVLVGGMLGVVWLAARMMFSRRAAWAAAILTLSSSVFVNWSTSAYIDIPDGFYHGLTFALALLWLRRGGLRYALLAGAFAGLALWVKQSSLVLIPALAVAPLLRLRWPPVWREAGRELLLGLAALSVLLLLAGPWYLRSYFLAGAGGVLPGPSTYDELFINRSLAALIDFWARRADWGLPFALLTLAGGALWLAALVHPPVSGLADSHSNIRRAILLWAAFVIPYHLIWWWQFTYQSRYLLTSLPMYAAMAGLAFERLLARLPLLTKTPSAATLALAVGLVGLGIYPRLGAVYYLAADPAQSDDVKLTRRAGDQWLLAKHVTETIPAGAKLYVMDGALAYWLYDYELRVGYPTRLDELRGYDYFVAAPWGRDVLASLGQSSAEIDQALRDPSLFTELYRSSANGQVLYRIHFR